MKYLGIVGLICLSLAGCATQRQSEGTAGGAVAGVIVGGPVGAVVGVAVTAAPAPLGAATAMSGAQTARSCGMLTADPSADIVEA